MQEADSVTSKKSFRSSREALFPDRRPSMFVAGPVCRVWADLIEYDNRVSATVRSPEYVATEDGGSGAVGAGSRSVSPGAASRDGVLLLLPGIGLQRRPPLEPQLLRHDAHN
jgi:hypothetical protein